MITPQQIDQVSFSKASFGGYNMQQVDEFLEPLTEDYVTLYKENALLKSKMRVLASKLEEYRKCGVEAKTASGDAKAAADKMLLETKAKCDRMLKEATAKAQAITASAVPAAPCRSWQQCRGADRSRERPGGGGPSGRQRQNCRNSGADARLHSGSGAH